MFDLFCTICNYFVLACFTVAAAAFGISLIVMAFPVLLGLAIGCILHYLIVNIIFFMLTGHWGRP